MLLRMMICHTSCENNTDAAKAEVNLSLDITSKNLRSQTRISNILIL